MILGKLHAENVFSYKTLDIDFTQFNDALVVGATGSGKSAIFDIVSWAIYGQTERSKDIVRDTPVATKPRKAYASLELYIDEDVYRIERTKVRGMRIEVYVNDELQNFRTNAAQAQRFIINAVGYDYKSFINAAYFTQRDFGSLIEGKSTERIKILERIFDLDFFPHAKKQIQKDIQRAEVDLATVRGKLEALRVVQGETDIEEDIERRKQLKRAMNQARSAIKDHEEEYAEVEAAEQIAKDREELRQERARVKRERDEYITDTREEIEKLQDAIANTRKADESLTLKQLQDKQDAVDVKLTHLRAQREKLQRTSRSIETKISIDSAERKRIEEALDMEACPACGRRVSKADTIKWTQEKDVLVLNLKEYATKRNSIDKKIEIVNENINKLARRWNNYQTRIAKEEARKTEREAVALARERVKTLEANIAKKKKAAAVRLKEINAELAETEQFDISAVTRKAEVRRALEEARDNLTNKTSEYNVLNSAINAWYKNQTAIAKLEDEIADKEDESRAALYWQANIDRVKVDMLGTIIPSIEELANAFLNVMLNGKRLQITADSTRKSNKLDIEVIDTVTGVKRDLANFSGGQKDIMSLAIYMALNRMLAKYSSKKIGFIILDEKFTSIDVYLREHVLNLVRDEFHGRNIYAISHLENIDRFFSTTIKVNYKNYISSVSIYD